VHALIIEPDSWIVLKIEDVLTDMGYNTFDCASTPGEAARMAHEHCPDIITSAVHLGGANGFEAVRSACDGRRIPTIFITSTSWVARARDCNLTVVQKPFTADILKAAVSRAETWPARPSE